MAITYKLTVNIEEAGTDTTGNDMINKSLAGHMWYSIEKNDSGLIDTMDAGYTSNGIFSGDTELYEGSSTYSKTIVITEEQYNILNSFGEEGSSLATSHGFGDNDYDLVNNSCIDYTYKALELIGLNQTGYNGDLIPIHNTDEITRLLDGETIFIEPVDTRSSTEISKFEEYVMGNNDNVDKIFFTDISSNYVDNHTTTPSTSINLNIDEIGAFYESSTIENDNAVSIADKTGVLLRSNNQKISVDELLQLDINSDGKLTSGELSSLNLWTYVNKNSFKKYNNIYIFSSCLNVA